MRTVQTLIDECIEMCGSQTALAKRIGMEQTDISAMQRGKRPISPATVGLLCDVLQLDGAEAQRLACLAIIATAKPEKQGVLRQAFFASWVAGAVFGVAAALQTTPATAQTQGRIEGDALYIVATWRRIRRLLSRVSLACVSVGVGVGVGVEGRKAGMLSEPFRA